jgi:hypothetical protein
LKIENVGNSDFVVNFQLSIFNWILLYLFLFFVSSMSKTVV